MTISEDRIKELREWVLYNKGWSNKRNDLLSVLDDYSSLRAEVKRLKKAIDETGRLDTERIQTVARRKP